MVFFKKTREKKPHFVGFFFARCARKLMSGNLASSEILEFGLFTSPFNTSSSTRLRDRASQLFPIKKPLTPAKAISEVPTKAISKVSL